MGCVFCEIARGERDAFLVYSGERVVAFLDIAPISRGHTLVVPRDHYRDIFEAPDDVLAELISVVKLIAKAQVRALGADGVRVVQNNGEAAQQVIFHLHFHVIPFYVGRLRFRRWLSRSEGEEVSRLLREEVGRIVEEREARRK